MATVLKVACLFQTADTDDVIYRGSLARYQKFAMRTTFLGGYTCRSTTKLFWQPTQLSSFASVNPRSSKMLISRSLSAKDECTSVPGKPGRLDLLYRSPFFWCSLSFFKSKCQTLCYKVDHLAQALLDRQAFSLRPLNTPKQTLPALQGSWNLLNESSQMVSSKSWNLDTAFNFSAQAGWNCFRISRSRAISFLTVR